MANWYEKTVEYAFVRKFLELDAMPLSGTAEKIGDTMFYNGNSFYIVEFKRGKNISEEITSEINKYPNVQQSIKKLCKYQEAFNSHYVVWGDNTNNKFQLRATYYIDFLENNYEDWELIPLSTGFNPINDLNKLREYLQALINEKKSSSKDSSSVDYGNTLIVDKDGNTCALSDKDSLQELELVFPTPKNQYNAPSLDI